MAVYQESDTQWLRNVVNILTDGGAWSCPCSGSTFKFDKTKKTYELTGSRDDPTNGITIAILEDELGYTQV